MKIANLEAAGVIGAMTSADHESSSCRGKVPHESMGAALSSIRAMETRNRRGSRKRQSGRPQQAYRCDFCGKFHVGRKVSGLAR